MQSSMLGLCHHLKVVWVVIPLVAVFMVDDFPKFQWAVKFLFGYHSMHVTAIQLDVV